MNITPDTKIADLLKEFPQLEATIIRYSPAFSALKNPVLRRTVAKVTSLQQAAKVGNVSIVEMVDTLRAEVGQSPLHDEYAQIENSDINSEIPSYRVMQESGPDHDRQFCVGVFIEHECIGQGLGHNKKEAERLAAKQALDTLRGLS